MSGPFTRTYQRLRRVDTRVRDTIQRFTVRNLGDASRWPEIIQINGLVWPYLTDDPDQVVPGVVLAGAAQLQIPDDGAAVTSDSAPDPAVAFGIDMLLEGGTLSDDGNGDFATVSGVANLKQAMRIKFNTPLGQLVYYPAFGNGAQQFVGAGNNPANMILANSLAQRCARSDNRIDSTQGFVTSITGDRLDISGSAVAIDGSNVDVTN